MVLFLIFVVLNRTICGIKISTKLGNVLGNTMYNDETVIHEFLGIEYGNAARFSLSHLNESWNTSLYNATKYGPSCIQDTAYNNDVTDMSENCLYLNIYSTNTHKNANLPVLIWIYGGGFVVGTGSYSGYNATNFLSLANDMIIVTFNYRLSVLGFLSNNDLYSEYESYGGLNGIYDQLQAINWVYKYIDDFGGNPNDLTIFGESAGGISVCTLIISPIVAVQPFKIKRAIIESGPCIGGWGATSKDEGILFSDYMLKKAGYSTNITELRQITNVTEFVLNVLNGTSGWVAAVDDFVLQKTAKNVYSNNFTLNVDEVIIGFNSMDSVIAWPWYSSVYPNNNNEYKQYIEAYISNTTQVDLLYNYYYPVTDFPALNNHTNASIAWFTINSDVCVICLSLLQIEQMFVNNDRDNFEGYVYYFRGSSYPYYAGHGSELVYVWDNDTPENNAMYEIPWNQTISDSMVLEWSNFAKYGNVSIDWVPYNYNEGSNVLVFDDNIRNTPYFKDSYRQNVCEFWIEQVGLNTMQQLCGDAKNVQQ